MEDDLPATFDLADLELNAFAALIEHSVVGLRFQLQNPVDIQL